LSRTGLSPKGCGEPLNFESVADSHYRWRDPDESQARSIVSRSRKPRWRYSTRMSKSDGYILRVKLPVVLLGTETRNLSLRFAVVLVT
jgi:hypothetical protein